MVAKKVTRRIVLQHGMRFSFAGATLLGLGGCGEPGDRQSVCNEPGQLSNSEKNMRASLGYVDVSSVSDQVCSGCQYFSDDRAAAGCGSCELLPGGVSSEGRCDSWSARS